MRSAQQGSAIEGLPGRVDDPPDPAVVRRNFGLAQKLNPVIDGHAVARGIGQHAGASGNQTQDFSSRSAVAAVDQHPITDGRGFQPRHIDQPAAGFHDPADPSHGCARGDFCQ